MVQIVKDRLIKKIASNSSQDLTVINAVINHQFDTIQKALVEHKTVELSGFGKFVFSDYRAKKLMAKYENQVFVFSQHLANATDEKERHKSSMKLNTALTNIKHLKPKITDV
jgi:nucleoid DNA-binding protein